MIRGSQAYFFPHEGSFQVDAVGAMNQAVEDGVGDGGIADALMPVSDGELTGQDGRTGATAVFDHLQEIPSFRVG